MSGFDRSVIVVNMAGAVCAAWCNARAAVRLPFLRPLRAAITAYCLLYVAAYVVLLVTEDVAPWSRVMRGVSIPSWVLVWAAPAWMAHRVTSRIVERIEAMGPEAGT